MLRRLVLLPIVICAVMAASVVLLVSSVASSLTGKRETGDRIFNWMIGR